MKRRKIVKIAKKAEALSPLTWGEFINGYDYWKLNKMSYIPPCRFFGMMHVLAMVGIRKPDLEIGTIIQKVDLFNIKVSLYKLNYDFGNYHGVTDKWLVNTFGINYAKLAKVLITQWDEVLKFEQLLEEEEEYNRVFEISTVTPYPASDIIDFMALTGIKTQETNVLLRRFSEYGISNLVDVNTLAKLGYFTYTN